MPPLLSIDLAIVCPETIFLSFQGLATEGWMMYYAAGLTVVGGVEHTPLKSLLSKCVDLDKFGKIFAVSSVTSSVASLVSRTITPILYGNTLYTNPGAVYFFSGMTIGHK